MIPKVLAAAVLVAMIGSNALAQPSAVHKTILQTVPFPKPAYTTVTVRTVVDHGGIVMRHTHPGVEMAYIVDGQALVKIMGRPDQILTTGGSFAVPADTPHSVQNVGPASLTLLSTYVVDTSKPILTPAP